MPGLLPVVVLVLVVAVAVVVLVRPGRVDAPRSRATVGLRAVGTLAGLATSALVAVHGDLGVGLLIAAPVLALGVLLGVVSGELVVRAPRSDVRTAGLRARHAGDYLPRPLTAVVLSAGAGLGAVLLLTAALGSPDDVGRAGRALARACDAVSSESRSPWPGIFYGVPLALLVAGGLAVAAVAIAVIVRRPHSGHGAGADDLARARSAEMVVGAAGVLVSVPAIGICVVAAMQLLAVTCPPLWWTVAAWVLLASVPGWAALLGRSAVAVLAPRAPVTAP